MKTLLSLILAASAALLPGADLKLVWSDEFDQPGRPDPAKWDYEEGFVRNEEAQFYTRDRRENARVEDGMLVIEGRREQVPNPRYRDGATGWQRSRKVADYTSAALVTWHKASWQFGRVEVRAKLPKGKGMWPAIWMMGTNRDQVGWPRCGEIDIMEQLGRLPDIIHGTVHYAAEGSQHRSNGGKTQTKAPGDGFHVYALEWDAHHLAFLFDGVKYHTVDLDQMPAEEAAQFRQPFYLLINLALGGAWGGELDPAALPQKFLVDYVRIYQEDRP